jgi:hypothetical protein
MTIASRVAQIHARHRAAFGERVTFGADPRQYAVIFGTPKTADLGSLPQGAVDAADSDLLVCNASPSDFAAWPAVRDTLTRLVNGESMTVLAVRPEVSGGVPVALRLVVYRTPAKDSATAGPSGTRKTYQPPPSTV